MVGIIDVASVAGLMIVDRNGWYDHQKDYLSDRRYRVRCLAGCGNMVFEQLTVLLGGVRYEVDLDYRNGKASVMGPYSQMSVRVLDCGGWVMEYVHD